MDPRTVKTRRAYELYRTHRGAISRADLNQKLRAEGLAPIAERSYRHLAKLHQANQAEYVPINQFDVSQLPKAS